EPNLIYTWSLTSFPTGATLPTLSINGANAAKNTTATFYAAGSYVFKATITDVGGLTATSSIPVTVNQTTTTITVTPNPVALQTAATQQFIASAKDQFNTTMTTQPTFTWTATAGIFSTTTPGLYTAPSTAGS